MKKATLLPITNLILFLFFSVNLSYGQISNQSDDYSIKFNQISPSEFIVELKVKDYNISQIQKSGQTFSKLNFNGRVNTKKKGWAELPVLSTSLQLSPNANYDITIIDSEYETINVSKQLLPSRGTIYRNQDPSQIPYKTSPASIADIWYPQELYTNTDPYIMRRVRGMNIFFTPFQFNGLKKELKVYNKITLRFKENNDPNVINPLPTNSNKVNREMSNIYKSVFINYNQNPTRWAEEIEEFGEILVIYTSRDNTAIQPWITWKKEKGYKVHEVEVSTGTNVASTVTSEYNNNNNILYVQLVGDWADIKSDLGTTQNAPMDPMLGCVVGNDDFHDLMVGRFSASTSTHVTTQGDKTITYERDPEIGGTWYDQALGIASTEGPGDDGEDDNVHMDNIKNDRLLNFTYTTVNDEYDPSASASGVAGYVNSGISLINYCGHGAHNYWVTSNYSNTNINSSTNGNKLPFIFSVACVVGEFHNGGDCFAEAWLRKDGGGAIATWMATINQPWQPPMRGQDYANDLLVQGYDYSTGSGSGTSTNEGRTTFGCITFNAAALMIDEANSSSDWDTYKTWTVFGDASVQVRTKAPDAITLSNETVTTGTFSTTVTVGGSPFEGAIVSLYDPSEPQPYSAVTDASGSVTITHPFTSGSVKLTVTGFNLATYYQDQPVGTSGVVANFEGNPLTITAGGTVDFTDLSVPAGSITSWDWTFNGANTTNSTVQNPTGIQYDTPGDYDVTLTVSDGTNNDSETKTQYIHVTGPLTAEFEGTPTTLLAGNTVDFTDLSAGGGTIDSWEWNFPGATPATSTNQNPTGITYNTIGQHDVTLIVGDDQGDYDTLTKVNYITVNDPNALAADFIANNTIIIEGQTVDFTDMSQNGPPTNWNWEFPGAVTTSSTVQNPAGIQYNNAGTYNVTLTVSNATELDSITKTQYIEVVDSNNLPQANFIANYTTVMVNTTVDFTDLSTPTGSITDWWWEFDGGIPDTSSLQHPAGILYQDTGYFDVSLLITTPIGIDTLIKTDYIHVIDSTMITAPLEADFYAITSRLIEQGSSVSFVDSTKGNPTQWKWIFEGAGTVPPQISYDQHPVGITYNNTDRFDVTLIVSNAYYSDTLTKEDYVVVTDNQWQDPNGFCDTISNLANDEYQLVHWHLTPEYWGYFPGHNELHISAYADKYTNYMMSEINGLIIPVNKAYSASSNSKVRFAVWDVDTLGKPNQMLEYKDISIGSFTPTISYYLNFDNNPQVNGDFFVGYRLYYNSPQDTFSVYMAPHRGINGKNSLYVRKGGWKRPSEVLDDSLNTSLGIKIIGCLVHVDIFENGGEIIVYPNPANNNFTIEVKDYDYKTLDINIYDMTGRKVLSEPTFFNKERHNINCSNLEQGLYLINMIIDGQSFTRRISIMR